MFGLFDWIPHLTMACLASATALLMTLASGRLMRGKIIALPALLFTGFVLLGSADATHHWFSTVWVQTAMLALFGEVTYLRIALAGLLRWGSGPDLSMMTEAGVVDPVDETFREYERVVDAKFLDEVRVQAKQFSTKRLSRRSGLAEDTIRRFKNGKNSLRPRTLKRLTKAVHALQSKNPKTH
jgi:hypothetical protein